MVGVHACSSSEEESIDHLSGRGYTLGGRGSWGVLLRGPVRRKRLRVVVQNWGYRM